MTMTAEQIAAEVLPDPWKSSTRDRLVDAAEVLIGAGFSDEHAINLLASVAGAMSDEYGA